MNFKALVKINAGCRIITAPPPLGGVQIPIPRLRSTIVILSEVEGRIPRFLYLDWNITGKLRPLESLITMQGEILAVGYGKQPMFEIREAG